MLAVTGHFITSVMYDCTISQLLQQWQPIKLLLGLWQLEERHTGEYMADEIKEKLQSLDQHGLCMTTGEDLRSQKHRSADNAANMLKLSRAMLATGDLDESMECCAHTLHLW